MYHTWHVLKKRITNWYCGEIALLDALFKLQCAFEKKSWISASAASAQLASKSVHSMFCTYKSKRLARPSHKKAQTRLQRLRFFPTMPINSKG